MGEMEDTLTYNVKELYSFRKRATGYLKEEGQKGRQEGMKERRTERGRQKKGVKEGRRKLLELKKM